MRTAFIETLQRLAERDPRVTLVVGDLGYSVVERFAAAVPGQYLNAGVAEQNMTSVAAGLALCGRVVFTYSIANFPSVRCLEQIRNDICYHRLNVKVTSVGGGLAYGPLGMTHHGTEDLAFMRVLPHMTVVAPADPVEAARATEAVAARLGPCYLRLGKAGERRIHGTDLDFAIGRAILVRAGDDATVMATGDMVALALDAADDMQRRDRIACRVLSMHTLRPLDEAAVRSAARETRAVITIEEHSVVGGLGSAVAEVLAESVGRGVAFRRLGLPSAFVGVAGSREYLRSLYGLTVAGIREGVMAALACAAAGSQQAR